MSTPNHDLVLKCLEDIKSILKSRTPESAAGSEMIKETSTYLDSLDLTPGEVEPKALRASIHFNNRLLPIQDSSCEALVHTLLRLNPYLHWQQNSNYTATTVSQHFVDNYAYCNFIGDKGFFPSDDVMIGFLLLGPETYYPDHKHPARELYIPLSGKATWSLESEHEIPQASGSCIVHPSNASHAMRTTDTSLLALFIWLDDVRTQAVLSS